MSAWDFSTSGPSIAFNVLAISLDSCLGVAALQNDFSHLGIALHL
jgi:hypothetical protein